MAQTVGGIAHFIEHMIFKGTARRKTYHVLNYLESVGGEVNAYTTREKTCIYASLASSYVDRATDLLTDIAFHATFPDREIIKERQVISEEIDLYRDTPDEAIFEDFDQMIFPQHPLGEPILGTKESIGHIDREAIQGFVGQHYSQGNVVYALVGNVTEKEVQRLIKKHLIHQVLPSGQKHRKAPEILNPQRLTVHTPISQAHEIMGGRAYPLREGQYYPFLLLNNMLGGPSMNFQTQPQYP